jgi:microcin C transport system substrate-binding protein
MRIAFNRFWLSNHSISTHFNQKRQFLRLTLIGLFSISICSLSPSSKANQSTDSNPIIISHAIAMHGTPKYPADFKRFEYTSPRAKKGGELKLHSLGTFDSFNGFIPKGHPADHLGLIYDTLMVGSSDEAFSRYGLVAKAIEYPEDRSWAIFHLNPAARFHDHHQVDADDVVFTFHTLIEKGSPHFRIYYKDVDNVIALDKLRVKFTFKPGASKEMPLTVSELPILPKHYWQDKDFTAASLTAPLGSGPYKIGKFEAGRNITYDLVEDYWGKDLPVRKGLYNYKHITHIYFRDFTIAMEAFKAGVVDVRVERVSKLWATAYTGRAIDEGRLLTEEIEHENPTGMQAFLFNLRNPLFKDRTLRQAMGLAFDFEWTNENLFYGAYKRTQSFFSNSELASSGLPSEAELALLEPFREQLPEEVFTQVYQAPVSGELPNNRINLRKAKNLLDDANYRVEDNQLLTPDGKPVSFEIMLYDTGFKRVINPFIRGLKKLGINAKIRMVDTSQYINRARAFKFDMIVNSTSQSLSPGTEQVSFWHSSSANTSGSRNLMGIKNPVVDSLVEQLINAEDRESLITHTRALDRVLLHNHYVIPHWHINHHRLAYWDKFDRPSITPRYDIGFETGLMSWWIDPRKAKGINRSQVEAESNQITKEAAEN